MTDPTDAIALVLELVTWVGVVPGVLLLAAGYLRAAMSGRYEETWGVIIASPAGTSHPWLRWMDLDRELQLAPVPLDPDHLVQIGDEVLVYFDPRRPDRGRLDNPRADGTLLRVLGWVFTGVGAIAAGGQIIVLVVQGSTQ